MPLTTRTYASSPIINSTPPPKGSNWVRFVPLAAVVGATVFFLNNLQNKDQNDNFDTEKLYASKSTASIAFSWVILKLCSYDFVVSNGPRLLEWANSNYYLSHIAMWVMKQTFFKHFVAGETLEETEITHEKLKKDGMGVVLDYSIEAGSGTVEELDRVAGGILSTVEAVSQDASPSFACLKVSGLTSFALLLRLSQIITYNNNSTELPIPISKSDRLPNEKYSPRVLPPSPSLPPPPPLSPAELRELAELEARLDIICKESHKRNVAILFDAEQTYYQPAIDFLALHYSKKYNTQTPIVYNTYQMYLKDGPARLQTDVENAKREGYLLGIKLVRGAYMHTERQRAQIMNYPDPIADNIDATHENYYKGLEIAFANLPNVSVMIASHNENTVLKTIDRLKELNVDLKSPRVQFAQLYGMGDHLSFLVVRNGFRVFKYVPFGPIEHVIPYLVRRMQENRGFIGSASAKERQLLWRELQRRLSFHTATPPNPTGVIGPMKPL